MKKSIFLYKAIVRNYLPILAGMVLSFVAIIMVFTMLLHIKGFFAYYENISAGFIPELKVRLEQDIDGRAMQQMMKEIDQVHGIDSFQYGYSKNFGNASFEIDSGFNSLEGRSLEKDISVIGFDYIADRPTQIELNQKGKRFNAEVAYVDYFGNWLINIEKQENIRAEPCHITFDGQKIDFQVMDFGSVYTLQLRNPDDPAQLKLLYDFLTDFISRFVDLQNTGIPANRFETPVDSDSQIYARQIYIKRKLLDCFKLIFSGNSGTTNAMLSTPLYHGISRYNQIQNTILNAGGQNCRLRTMDFFNINAEKFYNNNVVLMNYNDFSCLFETGGKYNLLYVYGKNFPEKAVVNQIKSRYPEARFTVRQDAIPTLSLQSEIFHYCIYALLSLFFIVVCCIVMVRFLKFYMVFHSDLIFMKIYGYQGAVFTRLLWFVLLASAGVAYLIIDHLISLHNVVLSKYYFPEISLDLVSFGVPLALCAGVLLGVYALECKQFKKLEYGSRGDFS
ncbi:MAG: hypothetical protein ACQERN_04840 [Thermodesulfobacteriota bacterium]